MNDPESKPAAPVEIVYVKDVFSPDFKAGKKGQSKNIERHWADQLVAEGYARFTAEDKHDDAESRNDPASAGP